MDFSTTLFRCSSLGELKTAPRDKEDKAVGKLGATCMGKLKQIYRELRWKRQQNMSNEYVEKGLAREEDGITLLTRIKKVFFQKNKERINNAFITGEPDLFIGEHILNAKKGNDIKCSWSWETFPYPDEKLSKIYYWQNMGYMALTGAEEWTTSYCLVNTPANLIDDAKRRFLFKNNLSEFDQAYIDQCKIIERDMIYDMGAFQKENPHYDLATPLSDWSHDIPMNERLMEFTTYRNEEEIQSIYDDVVKWRNYLAELDKKLHPSLLIAHSDTTVGATLIDKG